MLPLKVDNQIRKNICINKYKCIRFQYLSVINKYR